MKTLLCFLVLCGFSQAGTFVTPNLQGSAPSGISWKSVATGTALPIRSSRTENGRPGAVAYINNLGVLQIDPKGWDISMFSFTYPSGTMSYAGSVVSPPYGQAGLLPSGTWDSVRLSKTTLTAVVSILGKPSLSTQYASGNGASSNGWFNKPWAFPSFLPSTAKNNLFTASVGTNPNANVLGYGSGRGVFTYTANGVTGVQVGAIIPTTRFPLTPMPMMVAVPEPSFVGCLGVLVLSLAFLKARVS